MKLPGVRRLVLAVSVAAAFAFPLPAFAASSPTHAVIHSASVDDGATQLTLRGLRFTGVKSLKVMMGGVAVPLPVATVTPTQLVANLPAGLADGTYVVRVGNGKGHDDEEFFFTVGAEGGDGPAGPQGIPGAPGAQGPVGPQGIPGATGASGPAGPQGIPGATGASGPAGPQGIPGATGASGPAGPQGIPGATGAQGPVGPQGVPGATGPTGPVGTALAYAHVLADGTIGNSSGNVTALKVAPGIYCFGVSGGTVRVAVASLDAQVNVGGTVQAGVFAASICPADKRHIFVITRDQAQDGGSPGSDRAFYMIVN